MAKSGCLGPPGGAGSPETGATVQHESLASLRRVIDQVDSEIIFFLSLRQNLVERVAKYKASAQEVVDSQREEQVLHRVREKARLNNLDPDLLAQIYRLVFKDAVHRQQQLLNDYKP